MTSSRRASSAHTLFPPFDQFLDTFTRGLDRVNPLSGVAHGFRVDLFENETEYRLHAELPGVLEKDIDVSIEEGVLTITAERHEEQRQEDDDRRYVERTFGSFQRSFRIPSEIDRDRISANLKQGLLTIAVPKAEASMPKKITITTTEV
ncbi:MAG: Hsp20/alpha crystallin family protein [bacterium]|nr:Hsp20/alpha crystallin family protein [bacterium]